MALFLRIRVASGCTACVNVHVLYVVTGQLADCQLADWTTRGLADAAKNEN